MLDTIKGHKGLTLIEVLLACGVLLVIGTMVVRYQKQASLIMETSKWSLSARILLQKKMEEFLLESRDKSFSDLDFKPKQEGKFEGENSAFSWKVEITPFHWDMAKALTLIAKSQPDIVSDQNRSLLEPHLADISRYISDSTREITVTVLWKIRGEEKKLSVTTHIVKLNTPLALGGGL